jgi:hypothetical protein
MAGAAALNLTRVVGAVGSRERKAVKCKCGSGLNPTDPLSQIFCPDTTRSPTCTQQLPARMCTYSTNRSPPRTDDPPPLPLPPTLLLCFAPAVVAVCPPSPTTPLPPRVAPVAAVPDASSARVSDGDDTDAADASPVSSCSMTLFHLKRLHTATPVSVFSWDVSTTNPSPTATSGVPTWAQDPTPRRTTTQHRNDGLMDSETGVLGFRV